MIASPPWLALTDKTLSNRQVPMTKALCIKISANMPVAVADATLMTIVGLRLSCTEAGLDLHEEKFRGRQ